MLSKKTNDQAFFFRLCVYSCVYVRNHHPLSGEKAIFNAKSDENIVRKPCMTNSEICIRYEMAEWREKERKGERERGEKRKNQTRTRFVLNIEEFSSSIKVIRVTSKGSCCIQKKWRPIFLFKYYW